MPPSPKHSRQKRNKGRSKGDAFFADLDVDGVLPEVVDALEGRCLSSILPIRPTTARVKTHMARHRLASVTLKRGT